MLNRGRVIVGVAVVFVVALSPLHRASANRISRILKSPRMDFILGREISVSLPKRCNFVEKEPTDHWETGPYRFSVSTPLKSIKKNGAVLLDCLITYGRNRGHEEPGREPAFARRTAGDVRYLVYPEMETDREYNRGKSHEWSYVAVIKGCATTVVLTVHSYAGDSKIAAPIVKRIFQGFRVSQRPKSKK